MNANRRLVRGLTAVLGLGILVSLAASPATAGVKIKVPGVKIKVPSISLGVGVGGAGVRVKIPNAGLGLGPNPLGFGIPKVQVYGGGQHRPDPLPGYQIQYLPENLGRAAPSRFSAPRPVDNGPR